MKKLVVSEDTCISCGACIQIDEEHFDFSSKGLSTVKTQENLDSEALYQAIDACPVAAISIVDEEENSDNTSENVSPTENNKEENCNCGDDCNCNHEAKCEHCQCHNEEI